MNTLEPIAYSHYTGLPTRTVQKAESMGAVLQVITPHKGVVIIELTEVDKGIFKKASEISRPTQAVIKDLYKLEDDAKNFLLTEWRESKQI